MKRNHWKVASLATLLAIASPAFAQEGGGASGTGSADAGSTGTSGGGGSGPAIGGPGASPPGTQLIGTLGEGGGDAAGGGSMGGGIAVDGPIGGSGVFGITGPASVYGVQVTAPGGMPLYPHGIPATLDQAIQRALASNADMRLAEANLRQAQAAYEQAKLKLTHQVMIAMEQAEIDRIAYDRLRQANEAVANSVPQGELHLSRFAVRKSQLELQYLLGDLPVAGTTSVGGMGMSMGGSAGPTGAAGFSVQFEAAAGSGDMGGSGASAPDAGGGAIDGGGGNMNGRGAAGGEDVRSERLSVMRKRVEEALAAESEPVEFRGSSLEHLSQKLSEKLLIPVIIDNRAIVERNADPIRVELIMNRKSLTWRDILTAIADTHNIAFVIRDYGVLITTPEKANSVNVGSGFGGSGGGGGTGVSEGGGAIGGRQGSGGGFF